MTELIIQRSKFVESCNICNISFEVTTDLFIMRGPAKFVIKYEPQAR